METKKGIKPVVFIAQTIFNVQGKVVISGILKSGTLECNMAAKVDGGEVIKIEKIEMNGQSPSSITKVEKELPVALTFSELTVPKAQILVGKELTFN
jgi:hypothetical protein